MTPSSPLTFAPDADPTTAGVVVAATNFIPSDRGYQDAPTLEQLTTDAIPEGVLFTPRNAVILSNINGAARIFVGGNTGLYERVPAGWAKRITPDFTGPGEWALAQFGDATLAGKFGQPMHTTSGPFFSTFAEIASAPWPNSMVVTSTHQIMVVGYFGAGDGWYCSAIGDHTDWTPAQATQCAEARFLATPGNTTGCIGFGPHVIAFKERSMYWMRYVNVPMIWSTEVISNEVGTVSNLSVMDVGERILFVGPDDIYSFDGTRPVAIGGPIRKWFFERLNWTFRAFVNGVFDAKTQCAWWWYHTAQSDGSKYEEAIVLHVPSGRWGTASVAVQAPVILRQSLLDLLESQFGSAAHTRQFLGAIMEGNIHAVRARTATAKVRLGWMGDDMIAPTLTKIRPRFSVNPPLATAKFFESDDLEHEREKAGNVAGGDSGVPIDEGAFGTKQNAHWHSAELSLKGPFEITALGHDIPRPGGKR